MNNAFRKYGLCAVLAIAAVIPLACIAVFAVGVSVQSAVYTLGFLGLAVGAVYAVEDAALTLTKALPATGTSAVASDGIDLGVGAAGIVPGNMELRIEADAMDGTALGNGTTVKYSLYDDDVATFDSDEKVVFADLITQTGASGTGAAAASRQVRLPAGVRRFIRVKADPSASTDKSDSNFRVKLVF